MVNGTGSISSAHGVLSDISRNALAFGCSGRARHWIFCYDGLRDDLF